MSLENRKTVRGTCSYYEQEAATYVPQYLRPQFTFELHDRPVNEEQQLDRRSNRRSLTPLFETIPGQLLSIFPSLFLPFSLFLSPLFPPLVFLYPATYYTSNWILLCVCVPVLPAVALTDGDQVSPEKGNFWIFMLFTQDCLRNQFFFPFFSPSSKCMSACWHDLFFLWVASKSSSSPCV